MKNSWQTHDHDSVNRWPSNGNEKSERIETVEDQQPKVYLDSRSGHFEQDCFALQNKFSIEGNRIGWPSRASVLWINSGCNVSISISNVIIITHPYNILCINCDVRFASL